MTIEISPKDEAKIRELVESGRYPDANAVMLEALRLLEEYERQEDQRTLLKAQGRDAAREGSTE